MEAKQKAKELFINYYSNIPEVRLQGKYSTFKIHAKQCALIAVDEMIKQNGELYLIGISDEVLLNHYRITNSFLFQVKEEIEKL